MGPVACVASVSARVRQESWDDSKTNKEYKRNNSITRLETLSTQAKITAALWLNRCLASWLGSLPRSWNSHTIVGFCRDTAPVCSLSVNETHQTQVKLPVFVLKKNTSSRIRCFFCWKSFHQDFLRTLLDKQDKDNRQKWNRSMSCKTEMASNPWGYSL